MDGFVRVGGAVGGWCGGWMTWRVGGAVGGWPGGWRGEGWWRGEGESLRGSLRAHHQLMQPCFSLRGNEQTMRRWTPDVNEMRA